MFLTKEEEKECGEHYIVQDKEGNAVIYQILEGTPNFIKIKG